MTYRYFDLHIQGFDAETTGIDVENDRIVTFNITYDIIGGSPRTISNDFLINPGIPIPEEASDVHGISNDILMKSNPLEPKYALSIIHDHLYEWEKKGLPSIAYNGVYDASILTNEWKRHGINQKCTFENMIDPMVLDKWLDPYRRGKRRLTDVCEYYGIELDNAHSADADVKASIELSRAIGGRYHDILSFDTQKSLFYQLAKEKKNQAESLEKFLKKSNPEAVVASGYPVY